MVAQAERIGPDPLGRFFLGFFQHRHEIRSVHQASDDSRGHRRSHAQRTVNLADVIGEGAHYPAHGLTDRPGGPVLCWRVERWARCHDHAESVRGAAWAGGFQP